MLKAAAPRREREALHAVGRVCKIWQSQHVLNIYVRAQLLLWQHFVFGLTKAAPTTPQSPPHIIALRCRARRVASAHVSAMKQAAHVCLFLFVAMAEGSKEQVENQETNERLLTCGYLCVCDSVYVLWLFV